MASKRPAKPARPRGRPADPRTERFMIRATVEELEQWSKLAGDRGISLSDWFRMAAYAQANAQASGRG